MYTFMDTCNNNYYIHCNVTCTKNPISLQKINGKYVNANKTFTLSYT